jgi:hypothetical protein
VSGHLSRRVAVLELFAAAALCLGCERRPRFGYDFEDETVLDQLHWSCGTLFRMSGDHATSGHRSLEISLYPAADSVVEHYPGISFSGFDADWSAHRALVFDAFNPEDTPLPLEVRIDDRESPDYRDRFNRTLTLAPGDNRISIPLGSLATSGTKRPLDLRRVRVVALFLVNPRERHTLYLDRVGLE